MWPASASSARLPVQRPATNSTTIMTLVSASVTASMGRERAAAVLRSWPCASIGGIVSGRCARPGVRIRAMARALGIVALGLVGFWLVAHLLWMGPLETAAQTTAMWALGLLTGGVGVAAAVLGCALIVVGLVHYRNTEPSGEIHWVVLGMVVLAGSGVVRWWLERIQR